MMYVIVSFFTLLSIMMIVMLFDRQLCARLLGKIAIYFQRLFSPRTKHSLPKHSSTEPPKQPFSYRIKQFGRFIAKIDVSRLPVISALSLLIIMATAGLCYALITSHSLEVYHAKDTRPSTTSAQISQLLIGERLRPPPAPPEALFAELEAEVASYQADKAEEGYWPENQTNVPQAGRPLMLPEPDLSELNTQDHSTGYSGDMLASHLNNGHINIKNADRNWKKMNSEFVQRLLTVYKVMSDQYGYDMVLLEGYRSPARQARLLRKGSHVTKAGSYKSYHQFGLAGDSAFIRNGKIVISEKDPWAMRGYKLYGKVAKSAGLVWGGDWRMMDLGHVELRKKGVLGRPEMAEILTSQ
ncbi:M15 family metallopeptidase [Psychrobacter sp. AOP22-C1-22]|uniref:M15 family metallopeptidase n=1 Tax=unclassified Psychrobacter TaxID=196806 RepID=UPI001CE479E4|nr:MULTISPECIES: M15 family metallopeptidase [unclassified Psychrobacter]MDN5801566.1 M15 family metallopeptidase [Psychrobacter sp.]MDN5892261.1 M15 family metallopeptidase [Psychrobacter sp.]